MKKSLAAIMTLLLFVDTLHAQQRVVSVHQAELEVHRFSPTSPDLVGPPGLESVPLQPRSFRGTSGPCRTVFGFLPYWETSDNIRWDHLTHVAAFAVEVNSNGTLANDHNWPWTALINTAHANGVKVVLVATLFDPSGIETLITTPAFKQAFFENIKNKMLEGTADGINIDFEGNGPFVNNINQFMSELTEYMHTEVPGSEVTFDGPAVNWAGWDFPGLAASCDGIFIMGYAFAGSWSTITGANAPLTGGSINITDTLLDEYAPLASTMPEKLILGVPYFGGHWTTATMEANATVVAWQGSTRFRMDGGDVQQHGRLWDAVSQTPWYRWFDGQEWNQIWYDDEESLGLKWQLAQDNNLQGVGMWALNYDGTRSELWDELRTRFVDSCCVDTNGLPGECDDCQIDGDCDDSDDCTTDQCNQGRCVNAILDTCKPPVIAPVSPNPDSVLSGNEYQKQLSLSQGAATTWALTAAPSGAVISSSGLVSGWTPSESDIDSAFTFTARASNDATDDTVTWSVNVLSADDCSVSGDVEDCNDNNISDACDLAAGTSMDNNDNDIPDECDECLSNDDCDDGDRCTDDACFSGRCRNATNTECGQPSIDDDSDGVPNEFDRCPGTIAGEFADRDGCSRSQGGTVGVPADNPNPTIGGRVDSDGDSVADEFDQCPDTPPDTEAVDLEGCPVQRESAPAPVPDADANQNPLGCGAVGWVGYSFVLLSLLALRMITARAIRRR